MTFDPSTGVAVENGKRVPCYTPDMDGALDGEVLTEADVREETIRHLVPWLCRGSHDPLVVGRRLLTLASIMARHPKRGDQKRLAEQLGVSEARLSAAVKLMRQELRMAQRD